MHFKQNSLSAHTDIVFILHKIEGRVFLLGRNGFYNKVCEEMSGQINKNFFFVLLFKNIQENNEMFETINNLIHKGDQHDLKYFSDNDKILYLKEETYDEYDETLIEKLNEITYAKYYKYNKITLHTKEFKHDDIEEENIKITEKLLIHVKRKILKKDKLCNIL
jgi:hypothetical protein